MATIQFKAKVQECMNVDGSLAYKFVRVPEFKRLHCDMHAFRTHPKYGAYANSDLFLGMLKTIRQQFVNSYGYMRLDALPSGIIADHSAFLSTFTIEV